MQTHQMMKMLLQIPHRPPTTRRWAVHHHHHHLPPCPRRRRRLHPYKTKNNSQKKEKDKRKCVLHNQKRDWQVGTASSTKQGTAGRFVSSGTQWCNMLVCTIQNWKLRWRQTTKYTSMSSIYGLYLSRRSSCSFHMLPVFPSAAHPSVCVSLSSFALQTTFKSTCLFFSTYSRASFFFFP